MSVLWFAYLAIGFGIHDHLREVAGSAYNQLPWHARHRIWVMNHLFWPSIFAKRLIDWANK